MEKTLTLHPIQHQQNLRSTILIVDDNTEILEFISDDLSEYYEILTSTTGLEALKLLETELIHLVVTDIMMPGMDGYELCERIKSDLNYCHIPVILLTSKTNIQSKIEGLEFGADAYVEKPFSPDFLLAQISSLIKNRTTLKAYFSSSPLIHINSIAHSKADEMFLQKLQATIHKHINNPKLDVELIADEMNISRPTLYRKIKLISDLSPNELINVSRLKKAAELLNEGILKIYEISELIGYSSQTHFGRNFSKQFGMSPTEYVQQRRKTIS
jgi:two-component system cell cycle response regulator